MGEEGEEWEKVGEGGRRGWEGVYGVGVEWEKVGEGW